MINIAVDANSSSSTSESGTIAPASVTPANVKSSSSALITKGVSSSHEAANMAKQLADKGDQGTAYIYQMLAARKRHREQRDEMVSELVSQLRSAAAAGDTEAVGKLKNQLREQTATSTDLAASTIMPSPGELLAELESKSKRTNRSRSPKKKHKKRSRSRSSRRRRSRSRI